MDFIYYIIAGAAVGFAVGLTGIGGGSLMTPLLLMFGFPPHIAIGTDLLYAAGTKAGAVYTHNKHGTVRWRIAITLAAGSIPASLFTAYSLKALFGDPESYQGLLTGALGLMLVLTALVLFFKKRIAAYAHEDDGRFSHYIHNHAPTITFLVGIVLGVFVTLSSVGAGAFGTAALMVIYHRMPTINIIGTELAHAVPLTAIAGLSHLLLGHVDFALLAALLVGSLPATKLGTKLSTRMPENILQPILATVLLILGLKYALPLFTGAEVLAH